MLTRDAVSRKLAAAEQLDPNLLRFGARTHRYALGAPLGAARLAEIESGLGFQLPEDYRQFITTIAASGAGPGYGLITLDHPRQYDELAKKYFTAPTVATVTTTDGKQIKGYSRYAPNQEGLILLADNGCTKTSLMVINGDDVGSIYCNLSSIDQDYFFQASSFTEWYSRWLDGLGADLGLPQAAFGDPSLCAPPNALANFLRATAAKSKGSEDAALSEGEMRKALLGIHDGGLATGTDVERFFGKQPVRLCASCIGLIANHVQRGMMRWSQLGPAQGTLPEVEQRH